VSKVKGLLAVYENRGIGAKKLYPEGPQPLGPPLEAENIIKGIVADSYQQTECIARGLLKGLEALKAASPAVPRIGILFTDGWNNCNHPKNETTKAVKEWQKAGCALYYVQHRKSKGMEDAKARYNTWEPADDFYAAIHTTGGKALQITYDQLPYVASITTSHILNYPFLGRYTVGAGWQKTFRVDSTCQQLTLSFILPKSYTSYDIKVYDPNNSLIDPASTSKQIIFYNIDNPMVGDWRIELGGSNVSYNIDISANSPIGIDIESGFDTPFSCPQHLLVKLKGDGLSDIEFKLIGKDGRVVEELELYDDGMHDDLEANDGYYGGTYI
jgi:hypothetical protein